MIEITNKQTGPVQLLVRSRRRPREFTTLIVPGRGKGFNKVLIADELKTEYIERMENLGLISIREVTSK